MFRRITGVLMLRGGRVMIADAEPMLTIYDSAGRFVRRVGRRGNGPGEYERLFTPPLRYRGDSVIIWDIGSRRVSVFSDTGGFGRAFHVNVPRRFWPEGTIPDQSCCSMRWVLSDGQPVLEYPAAIPNRPGTDRASMTTLVRLTPEGTFADTIGAFESTWYRYDATKPNSIASLQLSGRFSYATIGDTVIGGNGDGPWLIRVAPGLRDTIELPVKPVQVTDSTKQAYADAWRAEYRRNPQFFEGSPESLFDGRYVTHLPTFVRVFHDGAGRLWLAQWQPPFSEDSTRYDVYSTRGVPLGRLAIPAGTRIADLSGDRIALIATDSAGIESVRVHRIVR